MAVSLTKFADLMQKLHTNSFEWFSVRPQKTDGQLGREGTAKEGNHKEVDDREEVFALNEDVLKEWNSELE